MALLKRVNDRKIAAKQAEEARHPIVKLGADRNVREAYFGGLAFAAVANDDAIDDDERRRLVGLGSSLELPSDEVEQTLRTVASATDDEKIALIEECARQIDDAKVADLFLKEFEELWKLGGGSADEYKEFRTQLVAWMGEKVKKSLSDARQKKAEEQKRIEEARCKEAEEEARRKEQENKNVLLDKVRGKLVAMVEAGRKPADIRQVMRDAGVTEHVGLTVLKLLLPKAKEELGKFQAQIPSLPYETGSDWRTVKIESSIPWTRLRRYCWLFDALTTKWTCYSVTDRVSGESSSRGGFLSWRRSYREEPEGNLETGEFYEASVSSFAWKWRSKDGEKDARNSVIGIYERILGEFTFRAGL